MKRPAPRKSSLAGSNPITPAEAPTSEPEAVAQQAKAPSTNEAPEVTNAQAPAAEQPKAKRKYPPKVSFYQDPEDTDQIRGAILHTMTTEGSRTLSQFINKAVMAEVERLKIKYNNGQPFPPVGPRDLPQGRPMGQ
ncbi:hypothetical protein CZ771_04750 [Actinomycetales bacterium JB111]|nr:hypothetical protein CZ771_04750 [Actinomycetales bacterium JB111]